MNIFGTDRSIDAMTHTKHRRDKKISLCKNIINPKMQCCKMCKNSLSELKEEWTLSAIDRVCQPSLLDVAR